MLALPRSLHTCTALRACCAALIMFHISAEAVASIQTRCSVKTRIRNDDGVVMLKQIALGGACMLQANTITITDLWQAMTAPAILFRTAYSNRLAGTLNQRLRVKP